MHPQQWPEDLDLTGKRIVVIGSGATAATLIPPIAEQAAHVTMLQRSPSYFFAPPTTHELAVTLRSLDIPADWTHEILRRAYIAQLDQLARISYESPDELHAFLVESMRPLLPEGLDVDRHFTPDIARGSSASPSSPTATCSRRCARERPRSSPTPSRRSPSTGSGSARARRSPSTSSSAPPASPCRSLMTSRLPSTANRSTSPNASPGAAS